MPPSSSHGFFNARNLNRILLVLGFIGIFDASLLSAEVLFRLNLNCGANGGCASVASDASAKFLGFIPVAYIGLGAYLVFTILAAIRAVIGVEKAKTLTYIGYAMAGFGALQSIYLQYVSLFRIKAFCPYCFGSACNMVLTLIAYAMLTSKLAAPSTPAVADNAVQEPTGSGSSDGMWVGIGSLATIVAVVIGASVLNSNGKIPTFVPSGLDLSRLQPVAGDAHAYGDPNAPIKITEFADLACTHCQEATPKLHDFIDKYPGKVYAVYRQYPLMRVHPMAVTASLISEYAARKGKFWEYADKIFATGVEPKTWDEVALPAQQIGLNVDDIKKEITKPTNPELDVLTKDMADAAYFGLNSTPTFLIQMEGQKVHVATSSDIFDVLTSEPYKDVITKK